MATTADSTIADAARASGLDADTLRTSERSGRLELIEWKIDYYRERLER